MFRLFLIVCALVAAALIWNSSRDKSQRLRVFTSREGMTIIFPGESVWHDAESLQNPAANGQE